MKYGLRIILILLLIPAMSRSQELNALQQALPTIKDSNQYVDALNRIALLSYQHNIDSCQEYARKAFAIAVRRQYDKGRADALNNIGIVYDLANNPSLAFRYYSDALDIYKKIKDSAQAVEVTMNIALVLQERGEDDKGQLYFRNAIDWGRHLRNDSVMALLLVNYLSLYLDHIPQDSFQIYLDKARYIATRDHDQDAMVMVTQTEGMNDLRIGKRSIGVALLKEAATTALAHDANYVVLDILQALGDYFIKDEPDTGLAYYQQGLQIAETQHYNTYTKSFSRILYDYYHARGNLAGAQPYAEKLMTIYSGEDTTNVFSGVDYIDYAVATKELENARTRDQNRKLVILILSIFSISVAAIGLVLFQLYRLKQQHAVTLEALNNVVNERNNQLQQKHEFNNKLISLLAHDFRQPINTAKNLTLLLKDPDALSRDEMQLLVQTIEVSSDNAIDIFENILQWIKRQLSGFSYEPVPLSLRELVDEAMRPFLPTGEQRHVALVNAVSETITIHADRELLQFINRNLIHNAVKFTPDGSFITVSAHLTRNEVIVCIQDEGKGINPSKLPQLFGAKKELKYDSEKEKGAGVALMICKDFVDRMFGRIWAENGKTKGAMFYYALPIPGK
ncbi:ATP-binding protein [Dinghuibacter silviterrae]|nr:tetratricopeptide repeat-containing sensor histidine kinase [Dinghuibacter silviterrae]